MTDLYQINASKYLPLDPMKSKRNQLLKELADAKAAEEHKVPGERNTTFCLAVV